MVVMRVRILFYCPRCGSVSFRPSISRLLRDSWLSKLGVHPQRCYMCRLRFYLFKPTWLREFVAALDRPFVAPPNPEPTPSALETAEGSMAGAAGMLRRRA